MISFNKKVTSLVAALVFFVSIFAFPAVGVYAQQGRAQAQQERTVEPRLSAEERKEAVKALRDERTNDIDARVEERRAQVRQDVCERRQEHFSTLIPKLANQSTRLASTIDNVYERVQGFYESGQLTVADYDERNAAVTAAQADAQAAVEVVAAYEFEFDCENPSVGDQLFGFREAVTEARQALKDYRTELVGLISSMRAAAAEQQTDATDDADAIIEEEEEDDA